ncbi:MAG: zinc-binding dehydrogenase, partial [Proteobacteria bacterium]|nr:zinc-binding dehydrogenase [Pseudomonadota bacterium]
HCESAFFGAIGVGPLAADHGGFASAIAFDARRLYLVAAGLSDVQAAILEPVTVAVHAVRRTPLRLGDSVVVIGAGPIGLLVMQAARAAGACHVSVIEPAPARRQMAADLGADLLIDPTVEDAGQLINASLNQQGADVVFECAGIPATIQQAVNLVRRGGAVSLVGVPDRAAEIEAAGWLVKEVNLSASIAYLHEEFQISQDLVCDGRIDCQTLHTATVGLAGLSAAFDRLASEPQQVKILVDPSLA